MQDNKILTTANMSLINTIFLRCNGIVYCFYVCPKVTPKYSKQVALYFSVYYDFNFLLFSSGVPY